MSSGVAERTQNAADWLSFESMAANLCSDVDLAADLAGPARRRSHARACGIDIAERMAEMGALLVVVRQRLHRLRARGVKACRRHSENGHDTISSDSGVSRVAPNQW
jgi:hypothetical protein